MLVLSRKKNEAIHMGEDIRIVLLEIEGDRISIGIEAPKDVVILRDELIRETCDINRQSMKKATIENLKQIKTVPT